MKKMLSRAVALTLSLTLAAGWGSAAAFDTQPLDPEFSVEMEQPPHTADPEVTEGSAGVPDMDESETPAASPDAEESETPAAPPDAEESQEPAQLPAAGEGDTRPPENDGIMPVDLPAEEPQSFTLTYVLDEALEAAGYTLRVSGEADEIGTAKAVRTVNTKDCVTAFGVWVAHSSGDNEAVKMTLAADASGTKDGESITFSAGDQVSKLENGIAMVDDKTGFGHTYFNAGSNVTLTVSLPATHWVDTVLGGLQSGVEIGNDEGSYYTYCIEIQSVYPVAGLNGSDSKWNNLPGKPELTYRAASEGELGSRNLDHVLNNEKIARALMAGYPYDAFGLSRLERLSDVDRAERTQLVIWKLMGEKDVFNSEQLEKDSYLGALWSYADTGTLPEGFSRVSGTEIEVLGGSPQELSYVSDKSDPNYGKYVGTLRLSQANDTLRVTQMPEGLSLTYLYTNAQGQEKEVPVTQEKLISGSDGVFTVVAGENAELKGLTFSYTKFQLVDETTLGAFVTDLAYTFSNGIGEEETKPYQAMLGYGWKDVGSSVTVDFIRGVKPSDDPEHSVSPSPSPSTDPGGSGGDDDDRPTPKPTPTPTPESPAPEPEVTPPRSPGTRS